MPIAAGKLDRRIRVERRALDDNGDRLGAWEVLATIWANLKPLRGTEAVMEQRLQGVQPFLVTVRATSLTRPIDNSFRLVGAVNLEIFDIQAATLTADRSAIEILATAKSGEYATA